MIIFNGEPDGFRQFCCELDENYLRLTPIINTESNLNMIQGYSIGFNSRFVKNIEKILMNPN
jgi:hypothetical protein